MFEFASHTGLSTEHTLASRQATHLPLEVWQNGVAARPAQSSLAWQAATQLPATQNGAPGDLQSEALVHWAMSGGLGKLHAASTIADEVSHQRPAARADRYARQSWNVEGRLPVARRDAAPEEMSVAR
jgi:hypothetical protein